MSRRIRDCGAMRAKNGKGVVRCELPSGHEYRTERGWQIWHHGTGQTGNWYTWPVTP